MLLRIIELVALIKDLPCDVPMDFLSGIFVLLLAHDLGAGILVPARIFVLDIKVLIHLVSLFLKPLHHACVPMFN